MLLVLLLVASVLSIVGLIWFSLRLKGDIDHLRKRVAYGKLEPSIILIIIYGLLPSGSTTLSRLVANLLKFLVMDEAIL